MIGRVNGALLTCLDAEAMLVMIGDEKVKKWKSKNRRQMKKMMGKRSQEKAKEQRVKARE